MASEKQPRKRKSSQQPNGAKPQSSNAADLINSVQKAGYTSPTFEESPVPHQIPLEAISEGAVVLTPAGAIADCNSAFIRLMQHTREEVIGTVFRNLVTPEQRPRFEALLGQASDVQTRGEFALVTGNGQSAAVQLSLDHHDERGQENSCMLVTDISEYKRAEEQVRRFNAALERRIASQIEASPDAILSIDLESLISDVNRQTCMLTGFARHELIGSSFVELFTDSALASKCLANAMAEGTVKNFELTMRSRDGSELPVELSATVFRSLDSDEQGFSVIARDISQRNRSERERSLLATIVRLSSDAIYTITPDTIITSWNRGAEELYGFNAEEMIGHSATVLVPLGRRAEMLDHLRQAINERTSLQYDTVRQRKDGTLVDVSITKSPITDENGLVSGAAVSARDITERKEMAQELTRARDVAVEAARMKSEFLANMSHEIRTPLNSVLGMTSILLDTTLSEEQRDCALTMQNSGETLLAIVNDILDFSKMTEGKLSLEQVDFNLETVVSTAFDMVAEQAQRKGLELAIAVSPDAPQLLRGAPKRLQQVLVNLINNAVKFTERGEVVLHVRSLGERPDEARLRFEVRDTGIGIPKEAQKRLFQAFSQVDASDSREHGGTGLGLAIARELVERMGGTIGVQSERGVGSTFWFTARFANHSGPTRAASPAVSNLEGMQVLVVDDNATTREIIRRQIMSWKVVVDTAAGAGEALRMMREQVRAGKPYTLALLDLTMPETSGLELARLLRSEPAIAGTELIIMSSIGDEARYRAHAAGLGIKAWLLKPIGASALLEALAEALAPLIGERAQAATKTDEEGASLAAAMQLLGDHDRKLRALIVEDNATNRKIALWHLEKLGFSAEAVTSGSEALAALGRGSYDVVLMDCRMPKMSGYETTRRIRESEGATRHTSIVAMTAHALAGDREKCLAAGMDDYLSKPLQMDNLTAVLGRVPTVLTRKAGGSRRPSDAEQASGRTLATGASGTTSAATTPAPSAGTAQPSAAGGPSEADGAGGDDASPLDEATIESLRAKDGLLGKLIEIFCGEVPEQLAQVTEAFSKGDTENAAILAHSLKGAAATFGAARMRELAENVERAADRARTDSAQKSLEGLRAECARVQQALEIERTRKAS